METKANYVAVGAFVVACIVGLVVSIMWLAGTQYSQEYAYYQTNFKGSVTGLGHEVIAGRHFMPRVLRIESVWPSEYL